MSGFAVRCLDLSKSFNGVTALEGLDLEVYRHEILAVVGPSGCGKTTLLRLIAGFERPDRGQVILEEQLVTDQFHAVPPEQRGVGMVFQDYALFPHLDVFENVAFGLNGMPKKAGLDQVRSMLKLVGLQDLSGRFPHELSGGERQRVALARALAPRPVLLLLDEPFSNLDADRRTVMREEVRAILRGIGATAIFVTHDQEEALFIGDRLAVFNAGRLDQISGPEEIFHRPATRFVADFMGQTDFLPGTVTTQGVRTEIGLLPQQLALPEGTEVEVTFRADDVQFSQHPEGDSLILARHFKGALNIYRLRLPSGRLVHALQPHTLILKPGTPVYVRAAPGHELACFHAGRLVGREPLTPKEESNERD
jgi:iron(III) transport system ATP-binding protein